MQLNGGLGSEGASHAEHYAHLIGGAGPGLKPASCIYLDGLDGFPPEAMLDLVEEWFASRDSKPKVVLVRGDSEKGQPRYTINTLRKAVSEPALLRTIKTMQFFPRGRTTIDDTWRPTVYFAVSVERPASVFFCSNDALDSDLEYLFKGDFALKSCAAYAFPFPERFSPLGYYWGMSVEPAGRAVGSWGKHEARRLSHWRDNTQIGVLTGGVRRFYNACDGYVRDAYPVMLLGEKHMERRVGKSTLAEAIGRQQLGSVTPEGKKFLWRIPAEKLAEAQKLLDDNDISLSGRRLEEQSTAR